MTAIPVDTETRTLAGDDFPWAEFFPGIDVKVLRASFVNNSYTIISKFAPGTQLPRHKHFGEVQAYTLEGTWHYLEYDWFATAGSYVYEPAGSVHTLHVPADAGEDAVVLFTVTGGMALMNDDDDQVWMLEDAPMMVERYLMACELQGKGQPPVLLDAAPPAP